MLKMTAFGTFIIWLYFLGFYIYRYPYSVFYSFQIREIISGRLIYFQSFLCSTTVPYQTSIVLFQSPFLKGHLKEGLMSHLWRFFFSSGDLKMHD